MQVSPKKPPEWKQGVFQIHFVHTGVGESMFLVFPDGTSMLLDCGDQASITRGAHAVPAVPGPERLAGEWIARYVERANPRGREVDWLVVSHFHGDHAGIPSWQKYPWVPAPFPGAPEEPPPVGGCARSGIGLAAETLRFARATDRGWPHYDDPRPPATPESVEVCKHVRAVWAALHRRDKIRMEPFRLGATDQFVPLHGEAPGFCVRNVCANGRLAMPDGTVRDLYAGPIAQGVFARPLNENAMSLGMVFSQGPFRFCACGDFSDKFTTPDGRETFVEDELGRAVGRVDVAKVTHHGHHAVGLAMAKAMRPQAWVAPVWDNLHCTDDSMDCIVRASEELGERQMVIPTVLPVRYDGERPWWRLVPPQCRTGCHVVVSVPPGGETFAVDLVDARVEDGPCVAHFDFKTSPKDR